MKNSYLGCAIILVDKEYKIRIFFLGVIELPPNHSGEILRQYTDKMLNKFQLTDNDVFRYITDNASNFIKCFKGADKELSIYLDGVEQEANYICDQIEDGDIGDSSDNESMVSVSENQACEQDENMTEIQVASPMSVNSQTQDIHEENEPENEEVVQYDNPENEIKLVFPKRISDIAHDIQLVLHDVFDSPLNANKSIIYARALCSKFNSSHVAKKLLIKKCKLTVVVPNDTRWNSNFFMIKRILRIHESINEVAKMRKWDGFSVTHLKHLKAIFTILEPFNKLLMAVQKTTTTLAKLYFILTELRISLEELQIDIPSIRTLKTTALDRLKERTQKIFEPTHPQYDSTFIISTLLDVSEACLVEQRYPIATYISSIIKQSLSNKEVASASSEPSLAISNVSDTSSIRERILAKRREETLVEIEGNAIDETVQLATNLYLKTISSPLMLKTDTLEFWAGVSGPLEALKEEAINYQTILGSSAGLERIFNLAGLCVAGVKNRTEEKLLNAKLTVYINREFL